ncbi:hypothetical protein HZC00_05085 [Candidatus Kaiserbacteria bacterium]|nr:hypothetical protein [Candidatus Kaiserbacteria bacterium]
MFDTKEIDSATFEKITSGSKALENLLKQVVTQKRGNYILNRQTAKLLEMFGVGFDRTQEVHTRIETAPYTVHMPIFQVSKDQYGYIDHGQLHVSEPSVIQAVAQEAEKYRTDELEENKESNGTHWRSLSLGRKDTLRALCPTAVTPDMVMIEHREAISNDDLPHLMNDYTLLLSEETRPILEKDFGVQINDLTLKEQFYLLTFLKEQTYEQAEHVQEFSKQFGVGGLRTFLTNSYDEKMSERIFTFAALTDEVVVKDIFASYTSVLDNAEKVTSAVTQGRDKSDDIAQFSSQLFEAFVRRSAHLFYGAEKMATSWYDAQTQYKGETMRDLQESFRGIALLSGLLADMQSDEHFLFTPDTQKTRDDNFFFNVTDKGSGVRYGLKIFVRPRAQTEMRTKKVDGKAEKEERTFQARINIELSLDELPSDNLLRKAFLNHTEYADKKKTIETSVIRFGFDLDDQYDPPRISFDMGRNEWQDETQKRTGDVLGRILDQIAPHGHHLIESFDPKFSDPDTFAKIAEEFRSYCSRISA